MENKYIVANRRMLICSGLLGALVTVSHHTFALLGRQII
jgi:hypothetical protein